MTGDPIGPAERRGMALRDPPADATKLALGLVKHEAHGREAAEDLVRAGERVLQRLHEELARVLGGDGYAALEGRALDLARRRHSFLGTGNSGGAPTRALEEALAALRGRDPQEGSDALQTVCAYLIGLLFTFLGEPLTTHLIRITWPGLTNEEADGGEREIR